MSDAIPKSFAAEIAANQAKNVHILDSVRSNSKNNIYSLEFIRRRPINSKTNALGANMKTDIKHGSWHGCGGHYDRKKL